MHEELLFDSRCKPGTTLKSDSVHTLEGRLGTVSNGSVYRRSGNCDDNSDGLLVAMNLLLDYVMSSWVCVVQCGGFTGTRSFHTYEHDCIRYLG